MYRAFLPFFFVKKLVHPQTVGVCVGICRKRCAGPIVL